MSDCNFTQRFEYSPCWLHLQRCRLVVTWLVPRETVAVSAHVMCRPTIMHQFTVSRFRSHVRRVHVCLAVTCHLSAPFWQNGRNLLSATAVIRGWKEYRNKSQYRKLTLEKKILPLFLQGLEPGTFQSRVHSSATEPSSAPQL